MIDLDALERAARAATPGPWQEFAESGDWWMAQVQPDGGPGETVLPNTLEPDQPDIDYIAAANPAVVLALIARLRLAEEQLQSLQDDAEDMRTRDYD